MHTCELKLYEMQLKTLDDNDDLGLDEDDDAGLNEKHLTNPIDAGTTNHAHKNHT